VSGFDWVKSERDVAACIQADGFCCNRIETVDTNGPGATKALDRAWSGEDIAYRKGKNEIRLSGRICVVATAYPVTGAHKTAGSLVEKFTWWNTSYPITRILLQGEKTRFLDLDHVERPGHDFCTVEIPTIDREITELDTDPAIPPPVSVRDQNRIRIAALGTLLHGGRTVDFDWWLWAEECLRHSDETGSRMGHQLPRRLSA